MSPPDTGDITDDSTSVGVGAAPKPQPETRSFAQGRAAEAVIATSPIIAATGATVGLWALGIPEGTVLFVALVVLTLGIAWVVWRKGDA